MAVLTVTSEITKRVDVTYDYQHLEINNCCIHNVRPTIKEVYTGKRKDKFQGVVISCGHDECLRYQWTVTDAINAWNKFNKSKQ